MLTQLVHIFHIMDYYIYQQFIAMFLGLKTDLYFADRKIALGALQLLHFFATVQLFINQIV